ncbi:hypothetical protein [Thermococcus sp. Bubb.Bath]|uniref:hypothetical protein n=1 Tax=Thermococcus sp. Bubb.Bath TaxID=1638242 RepID=UPI00143A579E|nr:hypothetical protein [Thermococcus sp. Bubb.Bath]NJF25243.1 hypothetical protein [Thermococcus sp. Bubb.Bath]
MKEPPSYLLIFLIHIEYQIRIFPKQEVIRRFNNAILPIYPDIINVAPLVNRLQKRITPVMNPAAKTTINLRRIS